MRGKNARVNSEDMPEILEIGQMRVTPFISSRFRLDGGSMFGVVPRALWERKAPPDGRNRILLNCNSLLVESGGVVALVEPGMGSKYDARQREIYGLDDVGMGRALRLLGRDPSEIDLLLPTHLHFDHAGGCTSLDAAGNARPVFSRARVVVQRREWEAAARPHPLVAGSYRSEDFAPLSQRIELVDGEAEVAPGVSVELTGGHTPGHQVVRLSSQGREAVFAGDLVPTTAHLKLNWLMAWDLEPEKLYDEKARLLERCAKKKTMIFWAHDPDWAACRVVEKEPGRFSIEEGSAVRAAMPGARTGPA